MMDFRKLHEEATALVAEGVQPKLYSEMGSPTEHRAGWVLPEMILEGAEGTQAALSARILAAKAECERTLQVSSSPAARRAAKRILRTLYV